MFQVTKLVTEDSFNFSLIKRLEHSICNSDAIARYGRTISEGIWDRYLRKHQSWFLHSALSTDFLHYCMQLRVFVFTYLAYEIKRGDYVWRDQPLEYVESHNQDAECYKAACG